MKLKALIVMMLVCAVVAVGCNKGGGNKATAGTGDGNESVSDSADENQGGEQNGKCPGDMVKISPGKFMMGCSPHDNYCNDNEKPRHEVEITKGFCMDEYEVTQGDYEKVMGENPSSFSTCGADCPVETVKWDEARTYCEKAGKRLPTEAEWEYAARAGTTTKYYWGDEMDGDYAWYYGNSGDGTHPVGKKKPNGYGLYDMAGNVYELVNDWYGEDYYRKSPAKDPEGPATGEYRVLRGGSWNYSTLTLRSSVRYRTFGIWNYVLGFRCARDF